MSTASEALPTGWPFPVRRWRDGHIEPADDVVAEEHPVQLSYQGIPHVVLLATPADLEDLGVGFTLTAAIVGRRGGGRAGGAVARAAPRSGARPAPAGRAGGSPLPEPIVGRAEEIRAVELQRPGGTLEV